MDLSKAVNVLLMGCGFEKMEELVVEVFYRYSFYNTRSKLFKIIHM